MAKPSKEFIAKAQELISELKEHKEEYTPKKWKQVQGLPNLSKTDAKEFVRQFKKLSGASDFDLPDIIFSEK